MEGGVVSYSILEQRPEVSAVLNHVTGELGGGGDILGRRECVTVS